MENTDKVIRQRIKIVVVSAVLLATAAACHAGVSDIIAKMPAKDPAEGMPLAAAIVKLGPAGMKELCGMITPPANTADAKARFALHGVVLYVKRPGAETERAMVERVLLDALSAAKDADVKQFFIYQIQLSGSDTSAKPLGKLLGDKRLCEPATRALLRIGTDGSTAQLRGALTGAKGKNLVTLVRALGVARDKASAVALIPHAKAEDRDLRHTALFAIGNIGDASAAGALSKAAEAKSNYERAIGTKFYLLLARRLGEAGDKTACAKICRGLLASRTKPTDGNARCAAIRVLADVLAAEAMDDIFAALNDKSVYVRDTATSILGNIKASGMEKKLAARFKDSTPPIKVAIVTALGKSSTKDTLGTLLAAASDSDKSVRIAAIGALASAAPQKAAEVASATMKSTDADEIAAAKGALLRVEAKGLAKAAAGGLAKASTVGKVALLEVLAARGATDQKDAVMAMLDDKEESIRLAAARGLGAIAGANDIPQVLKKMLAAADSRQQAALRSAALVAIRRTKAGAKPVLAALAGAKGTPRAVLLGLLVGIGGGDALTVVLKDTAGGDKTVRDAAVRALAGWPEVSAAEHLLALAGKTDNRTHRTLAVRGYVRLASLAGKRDPAQAVEMFAKALIPSKEPAEQKLILGGLSGVRTVEAMTLAAGYLDSEALREEAAMAVVKIVCPTGRRQKLLKGPTVKKTLEKVIAVAKNKRTLDTARRYVGRK